MNFPVPVRRFACAAWLVGITTATWWPSLQVQGPVPRTDLYLHLIAFGTLAALTIASAFFGPALSRRNIARAALAAAAFSAFNETVQLVPILGRTFSFSDLAANITGVALAALAALAITPRPRSGSAAIRATDPPRSPPHADP